MENVPDSGKKPMDLFTNAEALQYYFAKYFTLYPETEDEESITDKELMQIILTHNKKCYELEKILTKDSPTVQKAREQFQWNRAFNTDVSLEELTFVAETFLLEYEMSERDDGKQTTENESDLKKGKISLDDKETPDPSINKSIADQNSPEPTLEVQDITSRTKAECIETLLGLFYHAHKIEKRLVQYLKHFRIQECGGNDKTEDSDNAGKDEIEKQKTGDPGNSEDSMEDESTGGSGKSEDKKLETEGANNANKSEGKMRNEGTDDANKSEGKMETDGTDNANKSEGKMETEGTDDANKSAGKMETDAGRSEDKMETDDAEKSEDKMENEGTDSGKNGVKSEIESADRVGKAEDKMEDECTDCGGNGVKSEIVSAERDGKDEDKMEDEGTDCGDNGVKSEIESADRVGKAEDKTEGEGSDCGKKEFKSETEIAGKDEKDEDNMESESTDNAGKNEDTIETDSLVDQVDSLISPSEKLWTDRLEFIQTFKLLIRATLMLYKRLIPVWLRMTEEVIEKSRSLESKGKGFAKQDN